MPPPVDQLRKADARSRVPLEGRRSGPWLLDLYRSALGKKYVMAITGVIGIGFLVGHLLGNLKLYQGPEATEFYAEWLRGSLGYPLLPRTWTLWALRIMLIVALVLHVHAAYALTLVNHRARPRRYASRPDYVVADFAGRTMRWTGVLTLLFLAYHLADYTWGVEALPGSFERGAVYANVVASLSVPVVGALYAVSMVALGVHLYHGTWSMFQSLGVNHPRFNRWRHGLALGLSVVLTVGFLSFPVAVWTGILA